MIKRLYVHNFRCLENFELLLADRPSCLLIGKNGSGKSSIGLALEVLQSIGRGINNVNELVNPGDMTRGRTDVPVRFEIEVSIGDSNYVYTVAFELSAGQRNLSIFEENLHVDGMPILLRSVEEVQLYRPGTDKSQTLQLSSESVAVPLFRSSAAPLNTLMTWLNIILILSPAPALISGESEGKSFTPDRLLRRLGDWFTRIVSQWPAAYSEIDKYLKQVMPDFKDIQIMSIGTDFKTLDVQFEQGDAHFRLPFNDMSDGEKCFFICAVVIAANKAYGPLFCFWDEPESYLAPDEVSEFVVLLRRNYQAGAQLLVTSHNVEAVRRFSDDNTFVLQRRNHFEPTQIRELSTLEISGGLSEALIRGDVEWA